MTQLLLDIVIVGLLCALGAWTVLVRQTRTAAIVFITYGLLLALAWIRLGAIDVALTEAAIGSGVTGMLLINAAARLYPGEKLAAWPALPFRIVAGLACAGVAAGLGAMPFYAPFEPASLAGEAMANLSASGLENPVAGVLFVFRAFDTLLEKVVLLLALIGVWSLAPDRFWGGAPGLRLFAQPASVLVLLARTLPPFGIMFAVYMTWIGADAPGGAFQGGTVLAAMWILVMMAGVWIVPPASSPWLRTALLVGPVGLLATGLAGFFLAEAFLAYPEGYAKPVIIAVEFALTLSIGVTLGLLAAGPPAKAPPA